MLNFGSSSFCIATCMHMTWSLMPCWYEILYIHCYDLELTAMYILSQCIELDYDGTHFSNFVYEMEFLICRKILVQLWTTLKSESRTDEEPNGVSWHGWNPLNSHACTWFRLCLLGLCLNYLKANRVLWESCESIWQIIVWTLLVSVDIWYTPKQRPKILFTYCFYVCS
jgi:hypothetical protein